jgi:hypothetical protein
MTDRDSGTIVTFYSYKGGTGRTGDGVGAFDPGDLRLGEARAVGQFGLGEPELGTPVVHGFRQGHGQSDLATGLGHVFRLGEAFGELPLAQGLPAAVAHCCTSPSSMGRMNSSWAGPCSASQTF